MKGSTEVVVVQIPGAEGYMIREDAQTRSFVRMGRVDAIDNVLICMVEQMRGGDVMQCESLDGVMTNGGYVGGTGKREERGNDARAAVDVGTERRRSANWWSSHGGSSQWRVGLGGTMQRLGERRSIVIIVKFKRKAIIDLALTVERLPVDVLLALAAVPNVTIGAVCRGLRGDGL